MKFFIDRLGKDSDVKAFVNIIAQQLTYITYQINKLEQRIKELENNDD